MEPLMRIPFLRFPPDTSPSARGRRPSSDIAAKRRGWARREIRTTRGRVRISPKAEIWAAQGAELEVKATEKPEVGEIEG